MILTIILAFISLLGLVILHELGHFILAKKFGIKVEEFGIGIPPRLFGKKIGETIYSLNLIPFGAFVKLYGEEKEIKEPRSFSSKPIWQRALVVLAGVVSFWIISVILLTFVFGLGAPQQISDEANHSLVDPKVQIVAIAPNSPAEMAGLRPGDTIRELRVENREFRIQKVKEIQELTEKYKEKEVRLTIERGKEIFDTSLVPRANPPEGEGAMGLALARTAIMSYPWFEAPWLGIKATFNLTILIIQGLYQALAKAISGVPTGVQIMGPVGIFDLLRQVSQMGINYYLNFIAVISIYLAIFNILPIPALDGGKLLFLGIEKIRGKAIPQKIEHQVTVFFFALLILLIMFITFKDIQRLF
jgi:regulator of sigma E protease